MTSGPTEKKTYTKDQILEGLYLYSLNASEAFAKARQVYEADVNRVAEKLKKNGLSMADFTAFVTQKETPNGAANPDNVPQV